MTATVDQLFTDARRRLQGAATEALGVYVTPRRVLGFGRSPRIERVGEAWHLGVLLVTPDAVLATGEIVRAVDPGRRGYSAESARRRAELRAAALRGGFGAGEVVHIGWREIDLAAVAQGAASGPLLVVDGIPSVRWSATGAPAPLAGYLDERIDLALHPPAGA